MFGKPLVVRIGQGFGKTLGLRDPLRIEASAVRRLPRGANALDNNDHPFQ